MTAARDRWHRWKERQDRGAYVVPVELNDVLVGGMLDRGLISERDSRSRDRIGQAIRNFLANALADTGDDVEHDSLDRYRKGPDRHA